MGISEAGERIAEEALNLANSLKERAVANMARLPRTSVKGVGLQIPMICPEGNSPCGNSSETNGTDGQSDKALAESRAGALLLTYPEARTLRIFDGFIEGMEKRI